jgi:hypothetical protein
MGTTVDFERGEHMERKNLLSLVMVSLLLAYGSIMALAAEGEAKFVVTKALFVAGNQIQPGAYSVKWETNNSEATIIFQNGGKVAVEAKAKCVEIEQKNDRNSMMVGKDAEGRDILKQIQFAGKNIRITFE